MPKTKKKKLLKLKKKMLALKGQLAQQNKQGGALVSVVADDLAEDLDTPVSELEAPPALTGPAKKVAVLRRKLRRIKGRKRPQAPAAPTRRGRARGGGSGSRSAFPFGSLMASPFGALDDELGEDVALTSNSAGGLLAGLPPWVLPVGIGAVVLLLVLRR